MVYDVLVIGGGPAGLYTAIQLAQAGHSVALLEEHPEIGLPVHCTGLMAAEAFSRFVLPQEAILGEHRATRFYSASGYELSYTTPQAEPETVVVDRPRFDQGLAQQAVSAGVELFVGTRVSRVRRHRGGVAIRVTGNGSGSSVIRGQMLILATGAAYHLHRDLELGLPSRFVQTAQVEVDFADSAEVEVYFGNSVAPGSFAWAVPIRRAGAPRARLGLMAARDADGHLLQFLHSQPIASRMGSDGTVRFRRRPIPLAPLARTFGERVLVVGDAAGLTKPTTGGGIYYSLLSAELAASVAGQALAAQTYSAEFLAQYQHHWQTMLGSELRWGRWFRRHAERLTDAQIDQAFQLAALEPVDRLIRERATFNWHAGLIQTLGRNKQVRGFLFRVLLSRGLECVGWRQDSDPAVSFDEVPEKARLASR